jgi:glycosyltransferase involved in cell wall biosynthesis
MNALITVVVPSYNHEKYVATAVDSCLSQTYNNLEVVVVDDGSRDRSVDLLRERYAGNQRVKILTQPNQGAHAAINEGIRQAAGDYIAILNSDDVFHHRRIETLIQEAGRADRSDSLVFSDLEFIDGQGCPISEHERAHEYRALQQRCHGTPLEYLFFTGNLAVTSSNFFFSRTFFESVGEFAALRYTHDWDWALRAMAIRPPIWVRENLLSYRIHGSNTISENDVWCHIRENAFVHAKAIRMLTQRHSAATDPSKTGRDAYVALLRNKSFLPLPTLYCLIQWMAGATDAQLLELVTADDIEHGLQAVAGELGAPTALFLSVQHMLTREHAIAAQAALIEERWEAMQRMEAMVRERDETIAAQAQMVEERWEAMQQMGQEIADRDRRIAELQARLADAEPTTGPVHL